MSWCCCQSQHQPHQGSCLTSFLSSCKHLGVYHSPFFLQSFPVLNLSFTSDLLKLFLSSATRQCVCVLVLHVLDSYLTKCAHLTPANRKRLLISQKNEDCSNIPHPVFWCCPNWQQTRHRKYGATVIYSLHPNVSLGIGYVCEIKLR